MQTVCVAVNSVSNQAVAFLPEAVVCECEFLLRRTFARVVELARCSKEFKHMCMNTSVITVCTHNDPCWTRVSVL